MKKVLLFLITIILLGITPINAQNTDSATGELVATYGQGKLYKYGSLYVVELHGSYREMGRQYGALRKDVLNYMNGQISNSSIGLKFQFLRSLSGRENQSADSTALEINQIKRHYEQYPNYNEIMLGINDTTGLGDRTYLICSPLKEYYVMLETLGHGSCSYAAAWGPYTTDSSVIAGRNYDLGQTLANSTEIVVYNPNDGSIPIATMGYTASIYLESGLNRNGLFMELNEGSFSQNMLKEKDFTAYSHDTLDPNNLHTYIQLELFQLAQTSSNTEQLDKNFAYASTPQGALINAADKQGSYSFEWMPYRYVKRNPQEDGLLVATNHFIDPSWGLIQGEPESPLDAYYTVTRMNNMLNLCNQNKGNITPETMMQIMSTPILDGGPMVPETGYQMVVLPQDLKIWFRAPLHFNWTEIDLRRHFS